MAVMGILSVFGYSVIPFVVILVFLVLVHELGHFVTAKLAGLYDRDHRTLRHLTIDELPWMVVWALSSTALLTFLLIPFPALDLTSDDRLLVWGTALGIGFGLRAGMRALWRRLTPSQRILIVGDGPLAQAVVRKLELFPDIHAEISGRIANCALLQESLDEALESVDRVVLACRELSEDLLERLPCHPAPYHCLELRIAGTRADQQRALLLGEDAASRAQPGDGRQRRHRGGTAAGQRAGRCRVLPQRAAHARR